jgi:hypothetical protein
MHARITGMWDAYDRSVLTLVDPATKANQTMLRFGKPKSGKANQNRDGLLIDVQVELHKLMSSIVHTLQNAFSNFHYPLQYR